MQHGRSVPRFRASQFATRGIRVRSWQSAHESRYRHVLVATRLDLADRTALLLGFELASLHQATLTLLHVLPRPTQDRSVHGLDAICLLHAAAEELRGTSTAGMFGEAAQHRLCKFVKDVVPQELLDAVSWRGECRPGNEAESIVSYVNESDVELVILSAKPFRWWLPIVPFAVRTIERRARANMILIRGQAPSRSS
jgi:nucleotide-binding universal stress UspA family protein